MPASMKAQRQRVPPSGRTGSMPPAPVIARLNREINDVLAIPEVRERMNGAGIDVRGGTPEAFGAEMRDDHARYGKIVQEFGIKGD